MKFLAICSILILFQGCTSAERKEECKRTCIERVMDLNEVLDQSCMCKEKPNESKE